LTHLLGFYRHKNKIQSIFSESPVFKDNRMLSEFKAVVLPLKFSASDSSWTNIDHLYSSHPVIDHIINEQLIFHTSSDTADFDHHIAGYSCGVLMHLPVNDLSMSRTGIFVVREGNAWVLIVIHHQQKPYLLECKGVGSGVGRYLEIHSRTQAGTTKTHERITGGMLKDSMEKEFTNLMIYNSFYNFNLPSILPFACVAFEYSSPSVTINLGLLLRLTPSNVRYSYSNLGDLDIETFKSQKILYGLFENINHRLFSVGLRHQNLNSNNLCFSDSEFVITDFEELDSIYQIPASLDSETDAVPLYLKVYPFRYIDDAYYSSKPLKSFFKPDEKQLEIDHGFQRSQPVLLEYYHAVKRFLGADYFTHSIQDWVTDSLKQRLVAQKTALIDYIEKLELASDDSIDFNLFIRPYIESFQLNATPTAVGDFNLKTSLNTIFLFPYDVDLSKLKGRIRHIDFLLRQLDYILSHGNYFSVSSSYQTPFLKMDNVEDYWDCSLLMFPFLQFVTHWQYFLKSNYVDAEGDAVFKLTHRLSTDLTQVNELYQLFKQSPQDFVSYLVKLN
tara:strand:+ start:3526 stop:5202 length:1677 start_codon:yes stop_codon:yes gene_type:complete